ncbi:MAG TPA: hypothetical protein VF062_10320 [Candidatus Limnocylindrales bacterium]
MSTDLTRTSEIIDPLLWRDAQHIIDRHNRPDEHDRCVWCGSQWPCPPRRLADCAAAASSRPWRESWTARNDLNDLRALPRWRMDRCRID